jgi:hypothetical protein
MHPQGPVFETDEPQPGVAPAGSGPPNTSKDASDGTSEDASEPPLRRPVPLIRVLVMLAFLLIPFFNFLFRDSPVNVTPRRAAQPVLREAVFCENVLQGQPVNPRSDFSLQRDRKIVIFTRWSGSRARHSVTLRWRPQQGSPQRSSQSPPPPAIEYQDDPEEFVAAISLPLGKGMPLGEWTADVFLDRELRATLAVQIGE